MSEIFEAVKENLTMRQVAKYLGFTPNRSGFISSPFHNEKTPSCKLYGKSYYDFGSTQGGDLIQFTAAVLGVNNWEACRYLNDVFNLGISLSGSTDQRAEIERRQQERKRQQEGERRFRKAKLKAIEDLHFERRLYELALDRHIFSPLSEQQAGAVMKLQEINHKLDVLCGLIGDRADQERVLAVEGYALWMEKI